MLSQIDCRNCKKFRSVALTSREKRWKRQSPSPDTFWGVPGFTVLKDDEGGWTLKGKPRPSIPKAEAAVCKTFVEAGMMGVVSWSPRWRTSSSSISGGSDSLTFDGKLSKQMRESHSHLSKFLYLLSLVSRMFFFQFSVRQCKFSANCCFWRHHDFQANKIHDVIMLLWFQVLKIIILGLKCEGTSNFSVLA